MHQRTPPESMSDEQSTIESLKTQVAQLQSEVLARDNLLAVAAHELRNPMHALLLQVTAALALAKRWNAADDLVRRLDRIRHIVETYVKRATLLLDVVRLDARGWQVERTRCDFAAIVREICRSFEPEAQFASCELHTHAPARLDGYWDRLAAEQIVSNLVSNAIKYGAGSRIDVELRESPAGTAIVQVRDRGPGIAPDDQQRIFDRFQQAVGSAERRSGFGIGLWLVRSLTQAHGGSISVESRIGQGSTFTVHLPGEAP
jgi:signal transduction histidine kinase